MDDEKIIELFFERSEVAIEGVSAKYGTPMRSLSYNILRDPSDADECVNDSYLALWNTIPPTRPGCLYAFVCRVTRNISLARYRYNVATKRYGGATVSLEEVSDCIPADETVGSISGGELTRMLNEWLDGLSDKDLYIFMRRYWYGDGVSEIARNLDISAHTASVRLFRLRQKLQTYLQKEGMIL